MEIRERKKSTLLKDAVILCLITLLAGLALSYTNEITKGPIEEQQLRTKQEAYSKVFAEAKEILPDKELTEAAKDTDLSIIDDSYRKVKVNEICPVTGEKGEIIGYVISVTTKGGYNPPISLVIGYKSNKEITGLEYLVFNESKSVNVLKNEYRTQFIGKTAEYFSFEDGSGTKVDAISGATISSNGIMDAMNAGIGYLNDYVMKGEGE